MCYFSLNNFNEDYLGLIISKVTSEHFQYKNGFPMSLDTVCDITQETVQT